MPSAYEEKLLAVMLRHDEFEAVGDPDEPDGFRCKGCGRWFKTIRDRNLHRLRAILVAASRT